MSLFVAKKLVMYRSGIVAVINAGITWIILIIAPLGLFSVILCTVGVFISSLAAGWVCDRSLLNLLEASYRDVMSARRESENINAASYLDLLTPEQRNEG
ncbi:CRISPR-associated protein Csx18 [Nodularia sp. UHCC 0506]|uniref:CRISPR-associated protein Csx18 n=1 Tax=Nodularia sp. UHCC 0506 TaxID=3110243 RepID=UPI002B1F3843|nr:CRISPR-associated protein Csx18 [Nodularia sp. UHCC 0506]MEA5513330.1 CRISPR-associated protein Csx18 [Nodularia sp. UHCC 0506]